VTHTSIAALPKIGFLILFAHHQRASIFSQTSKENTSMKNYEPWTRYLISMAVLQYSTDCQLIALFGQARQQLKGIL
jgi:hypothetical protein